MGYNKITNCVMPKKYNPLIPSMYELWYVILTSAALLVVGCAHVFLERYDLIGSSSVVRAQFSNAVGNGLGALDAFSFTATAITFIVWGAIGLAVFSLIHAFARASNAWRFQHELSSNRYIHPANFNRKIYWQNVVRHTVMSFVLLALLIIGVLLYLLIVIPISFYYTQHFLIHSSLINLWSLAVGAVTIFAGTFVMYVLLKAVIWQHRASLH